jgi:D-tyrosyl-tRNA(Tyr) deacylase
MRAIIQRVTHAAVTLQETGERRAIGQGLMVLLGVGHEDTPADADWLARKIATLRIFEDDAGKMNLGLTEIPDGAMLIVSQFTLFGDTRKGRRPSFVDAAPPSIAIPLYEEFVRIVKAMGISVQTGEFGADMLVEIANDGPVTLIVESPPRTGNTAKAAP